MHYHLLLWTRDTPLYYLQYSLCNYAWNMNKTFHEYILLGLKHKITFKDVDISPWQIGIPYFMFEIFKCGEHMSKFHSLSSLCTRHVRTASTDISYNTMYKFNIIHFPLHDVWPMELTHLPWKKWPPYWQTTILHAFTWMKMSSVHISLKFVPRGPIDNKPALVQVMTWRLRGDKPLHELMLTHSTDAYMRHYGEMS